MPRPMFEAKLQGAPEMERLLIQLGKRLKAPLRRILKKAAEMFRDEFARSAPRSGQSGSFIGPVKHAADTMVVQTLRGRSDAASFKALGGFLNVGGSAGLSFGSKSAGDVAVGVGPSKEGFYLGFLEYLPRFGHAGKLRAAFERKKGAVMKMIRRETWKEIKKTANRLRKRGKL